MLSAEAALAKDMRDSIPVPAMNMITDPGWCGGRLVCINSDTTRPSVADLKTNSCWLIPICKHSPSKAGI